MNWFERSCRARRPLFVFSHPNHELAVLGSLSRFRPYLLYLTDGGSCRRVDQTCRSIEALNLLDEAFFLGHSEDEFYSALLNRDVAFLRQVAGEIEAIVERCDPLHVCVDAVEFYNPVHDLALPLVRRACAGNAEISLLEIPLIFQRVADAEIYAIQRAPNDQRSDAVVIELSPRERDAKLAAQERYYHDLSAQLGEELIRQARTDAGREQFLPVRGDSVPPDGERMMRYERRGEAHQRAGLVADVIRYREHYLPIVQGLAEC